jgi:hypothetical protein
MKASQLLITFLAGYLIWISIPTILLAQDFDVPRPSPKASVSQHIGVTKIHVDYCRPSVRDRKIFGELIPFGKVWRTGANEATTISFPHEIEMENKSIPPGKYALFTIPGDDSWIVILNSEWNQWGAYHYDDNKDILRIEVNPTETEFTEMLTISFPGVTKESGVMRLQWENTSVELSIETDTYTHTLEEIDKVTKELGANWYVYSAAAQYHFYGLKNTSEAIKLIDVAIALDAPNPAPWMLKSQILAYENKYEAAIEQAELALEVCKDHNFSYEIHENEEQIKKWKELLNK